MLRVVPAVLALVLLSSCGGAPVADTTLRAPEPSKAVLLLYVGANTFPFSSNSQVVTTAGYLNIIAYSPSEGVHTDGAMARFSISSPLAAGFRAVTVQPSTYAILGVAPLPAPRAAPAAPELRFQLEHRPTSSTSASCSAPFKGDAV